MTEVISTSNNSASHHLCHVSESRSKATTAMSKVNSHGKSSGSGSVLAAGAAGPATKHHRRQRKNSIPGGASGGGVDRDQAADVGGGGGAVADRSTARDYAGGTAASHSQATTGARRDHHLLCPSRVLYENTYRIEPQVL